jgi:hypothetical protein
LESGFEGVGSDPVHAVAYLELGLTQELRIGLGDEQASDMQDFFAGTDHDTVGQPLGFGFLGGGELGFCHDAVPSRWGVNLASQVRSGR